jgi:hypothetical protein
VTVEGAVLLYVGISPKAPPADGRRTSRQTLRNRIRYHYGGNAEGSTLRLTLGCLLADQVGLQLRRVGSGRRLTFGRAGEAVLSGWMADHAVVTWVACDRPWQVEHELISSVALPLNLDQNRDGLFYRQLSDLRAQHRYQARDLPILHE